MHVHLCVISFWLPIENEAQQTPLSFVEEEEQFADCLELVSCIVELVKKTL